MIVVHGWWSSPSTPADAGTLVLWAEDGLAPAEGPRRPGRRPKVRDHPFALDTDQLRTALELLDDEAVTGTAELVLPAFTNAPSASAELLDLRSMTQAVVGGGETLRLRSDVRWRVPTLSLDPVLAATVLTISGAISDSDGVPGSGGVSGSSGGPGLGSASHSGGASGLVGASGSVAASGWDGASGPEGVPGSGDRDPASLAVRLGADLRHLVGLLVFAADLSARGRVLPVILPGAAGSAGPVPSSAPADGWATARWRPVLTGPDADWFRSAVAALPSSYRAGVQSDPSSLPEPAGAQAMADLTSMSAAAALDALVDTVVRQRIGSRAGATALTGLAGWREALRVPEPAFRATGRQFTEISRALAGWQAEASGSGPVRACFRLVEPTDDDETGSLRRAGTPARSAQESASWRIEFGLQSADEPSLIVSAEAIWSPPAPPAAAKRRAATARKRRSAAEIAELGKLAAARELESSGSPGSGRPRGVAEMLIGAVQPVWIDAGAQQPDAAGTSDGAGTGDAFGTIGVVGASGVAATSGVADASGVAGASAGAQSVVESANVRVLGGIARPQEALLAELGRALRLYPALSAALSGPRPAEMPLDTAAAHAFLADVAPLLIGAGFGVLLPGWWSNPKSRLGARLRAGTPSQPGRVDGVPALGQQGLVEFDWRLSVGDDLLTDQEVEGLIETRQPLVRLRGEWMQVDPERLRRARDFLRRKNSGGMTVGEVLRVLGSADEGPGGLPVTGVDAEGWLADLLAPSTDQKLLPVPVPRDFVGTLRPYQERGLAWLSFLESAGMGALLADDMGLGKTVQLLALIARDHELAADAAVADAEGKGDDTERGAGAVRRPGPTLLVCPMSLVGNWQREAAKFTPQLRVHVQHGKERPQGKAFRDAVAASDLVVTTYALLARDVVALRKLPWSRVVLDEAQAVKNAATQAAIAARSLRAPRRIAVTGTPVENRLADLWSLMEFANPKLLGDAADFKRRFALPIERLGSTEASAALRTITQPFVLRRLKTDTSIISDLPAKLEMEVVCTLTGEQAALYQSVVTDMLERISDSSGIERRGLVLATMTKLKQVCNHPAQFLRDGSRIGGGRSGKLARLEETLDEVLAGGEKALLFTQYAEFGEMLRTHLTARFGREVAFLHGGVGKAQRDAMVARFQEPDDRSGPSLFVLSLKAGGTGLTLTAANHVIHVDRWWNPAVEDQATDRAFRIGQTRAVQVRKFVCAGTLEEKISAMIHDKRGLAGSVVGTGEGWLTELSTSQFRDLITLEPGAVVS